MGKQIDAMHALYQSTYERYLKSCAGLSAADLAARVKAYADILKASREQADKNYVAAVNSAIARIELFHAQILARFRSCITGRDAKLKSYNGQLKCRIGIHDYQIPKSAQGYRFQKTQLRREHDGVNDFLADLLVFNLFSLDSLCGANILGRWNACLCCQDLDVSFAVGSRDNSSVVRGSKELGISLSFRSWGGAGKGKKTRNSKYLHHVEIVRYFPRWLVELK